MSNTMRLIFESIMLLLDAEEERCVAELREHRHTLTRQAHLNQIDRITLLQQAIDGLLNPPEEEVDETGDQSESGTEPNATSPEGRDNESQS